MKVAVITGGSSGIGAALARQLTARGVRCILVARGRERLERVARELDAEAEVCDVADRAAVDALAEHVRERHPAIHLLANNAGIPGRRGFLELEPERIEEVVRVNYLGGVWCLRAFLPLLAAGRPSHVVNVASVAGTVAGGPSGPYTAAKFAQVGFSRTVTGELATHGVSVHTVNPGLTHTEGFPQDPFVTHPVWRHAVVTPDRVASAIVRCVERDRPEVFVPGYYRAAALLQAFAPATVARLAARRRPQDHRPAVDSGRG